MPMTREKLFCGVLQNVSDNITFEENVSQKYERTYPIMYFHTINIMCILRINFFLAAIAAL